jgi:hypothetical protein
MHAILLALSLLELGRSTRVGVRLRNALDVEYAKIL